MARLRPIAWPPTADAIDVIDQRALPFEQRWQRLETPEQVDVAIREMWLRGAPLIGAAAAFGLALGLRRDPSDAALASVAGMLREARPTAVNLAWAVDRMRRALVAVEPSRRAAAAWAEAVAIAEEDARNNRALGEHALPLFSAALERKRARGEGGPLRVLTHCNAGWLATVAWGTATAPIYLAHAAGWPLHVWVDETRPRNQGASLTAWELGRAGVPHAVVADNSGGLLMQRGQVDIAIVGCDRVAANGDVCNKVGTYLKALAAHDNGVPFVVAMPVSTFDPHTPDGASIPIEERSAREVTHVVGRTARGTVEAVQVVPDGSAAANPAFDVTPARLVTALVTERGVFAADADALRGLAAPAHRDRGDRIVKAGDLGDDTAARAAMVAALRALDASGLNRGSTGNLSLRDGAAMLVTPTGMGADDTGPDDLVRVGLHDGGDGRIEGRWLPSSEAPFHRAIYLARPDLNAVVHVHAPHAAALACLRRELPAFHYMVAIAGGDTVPCVPYHLFGTEALSRAVAAAMADRDACLLANHGLIGAGPTLDRAMKVTREIESLCEVYLKALAVGEPALLSAAEMAAVLERFRHYGRQQRHGGPEEP